MTAIQTWELLSYVVTVLGLPGAILLFWRELRRERENDEFEIHDTLSGAYTDFLKLVIANPDLDLHSPRPAAELTPEQRTRVRVLMEILVSLFERAFLLVHEERMGPRQRRLWHSWDDFIRDWCRREDFRQALPELLVGEDEAFAGYMRRVAAEEAAGVRVREPGGSP